MFFITYYGIDGHVRTRQMSWSKALEFAARLLINRPKAAPIYICNDVGTILAHY